MERTQKLKIRGPKENAEVQFRDTMVLADVISEMEKELREAGEDLWRGTLESKRIEANERRETLTAGGGGTWKAASGAESSKTEIGPSDESRVGHKRNG